MIIATLAVAAALFNPTAAVQTAPAASAAANARAPLNVEIPEVAGVAADPTCGGRAAVAQQAFCVTTTQAGAEALMDTFDAAFKQQGWLAAGGGDNLVVYVKRKAAGGCDAFQVLAFAPDNAAPSPTGPVYIAFAAIPGDVCHAQGATPGAPAQ